MCRVPTPSGVILTTGQAPPLKPSSPSPGLPPSSASHRPPQPCEAVLSFFFLRCSPHVQPCGEHAMQVGRERVPSSCACACFPFASSRCLQAMPPTHPVPHVWPPAHQHVRCRWHAVSGRAAHPHPPLAVPPLVLALPPHAVLRVQQGVGQQPVPQKVHLRSCRDRSHQRLQRVAQRITSFASLKRPVCTAAGGRPAQASTKPVEQPTQESMAERALPAGHRGQVRPAGSSQGKQEPVAAGVHLHDYKDQAMQAHQKGYSQRQRPRCRSGAPSNQCSVGEPSQPPWVCGVGSQQPVPLKLFQAALGTARSAVHFQAHQAACRPALGATICQVTPAARVH